MVFGLATFLNVVPRELEKPETFTFCNVKSYATNIFLVNLFEMLLTILLNIF